MVDPISEHVRIDVRPPFWQRLREVFVRGSPHPLRIGFVFSSDTLHHVEVSVMAPCGVREIDLECEVHVDCRRLQFYPGLCHVDLGQ
jgi:hypothetical protein